MRLLPQALFQAQAREHEATDPPAGRELRKLVSNLADFRYSRGCPTGALGGVISFGRSKDSRRRTAGECTAPLQAQGAAGRHHQGSQAALVLHEARREDAHEAGVGPQAQSQESPQGTDRLIAQICDRVMSYVTTVNPRSQNRDLGHTALPPLAAKNEDVARMGHLKF